MALFLPHFIVIINTLIKNMQDARITHTADNPDITMVFIIRTHRCTERHTKTQHTRYSCGHDEDMRYQPLETEQLGLWGRNK